MPGISALYILDLKGKVLIYRVYRDLVANGNESTAVSSHSIIEKFTLLLNEREDESASCSAPVLPIPAASTAAEGEAATDGGSFLWLKLPSLYFVAPRPALHSLLFHECRPRLHFPAQDRGHLYRVFPRVRGRVDP